MSLLFSLFNQQAYIIWPKDKIGILAIVLGFVELLWIAWSLRPSQRYVYGDRTWVYRGLLITTPLFALVFGIRLPPWDMLPLPNGTIHASGRALMFFAAFPMILGGWLFGTYRGVILGVLAGTSVAVFDTHSPFTVIEFVGLALLFSIATHQRYRTWFFKALRRPFLASILMSLLYPFLFMMGAIFWVSGSTAESLDFAITNVPTNSVAMGGSLLLSGIILDLLVILFPSMKVETKILEPSPSETSLKVRFLSYIVGWAFLVIILLIAVNWVVAGRSAKNILHDQMASLAQTTTDQIPNFMNTGQSLIKQYASDLPDDLSLVGDVQGVLEQNFRSVPFFSKLYVLDTDENQLSAYPQGDFSKEITVQAEQDGLNYALSGIPVQVYAIPSLDEKTPAEVSFLGAIYNSEGIPQGILVGRVELRANPFTQTVVNALERMKNMGGRGFLIDGEGRLLYASDVDNTRGGLPGYTIGAQEDFYESTMADGTRQLVYTKSSLGRPWLVLLTIPASQAQELALDLALPMSGVILVLGILAMGSLYVGLNTVASALHSLMEETQLIAKGDLGHALKIGLQVDEIGQLRRSFEKMRQSLKSRMQELNHLLRISRGVASSLEIEESIQPILESALDIGADSARIVLTPEVIPGELHETSGITGFGVGASSQTCSTLDHRVLEFAKEHAHVRLQNPARVSHFKLDQQTSAPGSILAVALRDEKEYYGALWLAYDRVHAITDEEMHFVVTLAGQAVLAVTNTQLFKRAEIGRQRLAAILASTPDPVLVTDHMNRLLLANPAAWEMIDFKKESSKIGQPIEGLISITPLVELLSDSSESQQSVEVPLEDGRVFLATASPVVGDGRRLGRVCVLRDITHLKEMDELKSNFVATVSHDLRSPLTLMRGYTTMLEMVGDLNEKQMGYVRKIVTGVENMSRLIKNLLDLGRIEAEVGLKLETLSVHDIVSHAAEALRLHAQQKDIELKISAASQTTPLLTADQALLQQALHNLIENAIKYTPEGGHVWVRYRVEGNQMLFEIQDTGVGISPVDQQRLFEKFYWVERRDVKMQSGTGLGLAIVKSIAEQHGGDTWVESELGAGSTFYLSIPIR